jgi:hypothetical protein
MTDTRRGTERLGKLHLGELQTVEHRAIAEVDCNYCSSKAGEPCRVILYGKPEGGRLAGYAHVGRRALLLTKDIEDEELFGEPHVYWTKGESLCTTDLDDLLGAQ